MKRGILNAPGVVRMATDFTPRDDAGNPMDYERYRARIERESAEEGLRVERYDAPENPEIVAFRVVDRSGKVRGFIGFEWDAMEMDLPERTLERVRRAAAAHPRANLKLA